MSCDSSSSRPPKFVLPTNLRKRLDEMSTRDRAACVTFCESKALHQAKGILHPEKFYAAQFRLFVKQHNSGATSKEQPEPNTAIPPPFELLGTAQIEFESLTESEQKRAQSVCQQAALQLSEPVRNPKHFYTRLFTKYQKEIQKSVQIPSFVLPRSELEHYHALTTVQQDTARSHCESAAKRALAKDPQQQEIRRPHAFYRTAFHQFLKQYPSLQQKKPVAPPPLKSSNRKDPRSTVRQLSVASDDSVESKLVPIELIRRELINAVGQLEVKEMACKDGQTKIDYLTKMLEMEQATTKKLRVELKELSQLRATNSSLETERDSLLSQVQDLQERRMVDQDMHRAMTATFTSVSQELCRERQEKRSVEEALQKEKEQLKRKDLEIQKLKAAVKRLEMLRPSEKQLGGNGRRVAVLQRELKETQDKLAKERRKNEKHRGETKNTNSPPGNTGNPSLADFLSEKLKGAANGFALEIPDQHQVAEPIAPPTDPIVAKTPSPRDLDSLNSMDERIKTEIEFLASSYGKDELIRVSDRALTRKLLLPISRENECGVPVDLSLSVPVGYPTDASIQVEAAINPEGFSSSVEACKLAMDTIPSLVDVCRCEAQGSLGNEALFFILQAADQWVAIDWKGIQAKKLPAEPKQDKDCTESEICRMLIRTHHLIETDADRINFLVKTASKCKVGGFVKSGYPGLVLVEGLEADCDSFLERVVQHTSKHRESGSTKNSSYFSKLGKAVSKVNGFSSSCKFPRKLTHIGSSSEGNDLLKQHCEAVGLESALG